jgi:hypothetical protein
MSYVLMDFVYCELWLSAGEAAVARSELCYLNMKRVLLRVGTSRSCD